MDLSGINTSFHTVEVPLGYGIVESSVAVVDIPETTLDVDWAV